MKNIFKKSLILLMAFIFLTACAKKDEATTTESTNNQTKELEVIKVASHVPPMITILELIQDDLESAGYKLEIVTVSDNVQANVALQNKEVNANFFQHKLFMEMYNQANKTEFAVVTPIYDAYVSFYGKDLKSIDDLKDGASVAIPSDPTNMTRALRLLASKNIITLNDPASYNVTVADIKENPKNLVFAEIGLLNLNEAYNEKDIIFNYPTYIAKINLKPLENGLILEEGNDNTFAISLISNKADLESDKIKALKEAITSEEVKNFINENLKEHARLAF